MSAPIIPIATVVHLARKAAKVVVDIGALVDGATSEEVAKLVVDVEALAEAIKALIP